MKLWSQWDIFSYHNIISTQVHSRIFIYLKDYISTKILIPLAVNFSMFFSLPSQISIKYSLNIFSMLIDPRWILFI